MSASGPRADSDSDGLIALSGCRITRPAMFGGDVEVVTATPRLRGFPTHVNAGLGVCLKLGRSHAVRSDGRAVAYPADAVCIRHPGCVWSSEPAAVGFVSIDVGPALLPHGLSYQPMRFARPGELPDLSRLVHVLEHHPSHLRQEEALSELIAALHERDILAAEELRSESATSAALLRARDYLHAMLDQNPSLDDVARASQMNKFVLLRHFKRRFGTTPHHYLISVRVERSRSLLAAGEPAVSVAAALGFADQGHFGRHFKRIVGVAPAQFARMIKTTRAVPG
jgi:AraC-like DNA-binding protein